MLKRHNAYPLLQAARFFGSLIFFCLLTESCLGDSLESGAKSAIPSGIAGKLSYMGTYPDSNGNNSGDGNGTVTGLPDGKLLFYGVRMDTYLPQTGKLIPLRNRRKSGVASHQFAPPRLWDPARRGWRKVERPPECPFSSMLATVTALNDDKVLIVGGLCDKPRMANDESPLIPHTRMSLWDSSKEKWLVAPALATNRIYHSANLLRDNSVLITGGESDPEETSAGVEPVLNSVERYQDGKVEQLPPLRQARARHTATLLSDGSVLVVGGFDGNGKAIDTVEIWDPKLQSWSDAQPLKNARYGHSATLLDDGRVMIAGGQGVNGPIGSVEIRDFASGAWSSGNPLPLPLTNHAATLLKNGDVLVAGGVTMNSEVVPDTFLWHKAWGLWQPAGTRVTNGEGSKAYVVSVLPRPDGGAQLFGSAWVMNWAPSEGTPTGYPAYGKRIRAAITATADGRVLLSGGLASRAFVDWAEVYDPSNGRFSLTGRMLLARHSHSAIALDDGSVVIAGGWARSPDEPSRPRDNSPEVWNPRTGSWKAVNGISFSWKDWVHLAKQDDGSVLFFASRELSEVDAPSGPVEYRAWLWNPLTDKVDVKSVPVRPRARAGIAIRPDGTVLVAGGNARSLQKEYRCPKSHGRDSANDDETNCHDEPAQWYEHSEGSVELWDSRRGTVSQLGSVALNMQDPKTLVLKNGNVVLANYVPLNPYAGVLKSPVLLWGSSIRKWSDLPPLESHDSLSLLELADGSLMSRSMLLELGASSWATSGSIQSDGARPVLLPSGKLLALSTQPPYVSAYDVENKKWNYVVPSNHSPMWQSRPALVPLANGRLMVIANVENGLTPVQSAYIWNPADKSWIAAGTLARRYSDGQAVRLKSGRILHLGIFNQTETVCELWNPEDNIWTFCGTLVTERSKNGGSGNGAPVLRTLEDGSPAIVSKESEAMVFRESENTWLRMKLEINAEALGYGAPVRMEKDFYARVFDEGSGRWIDSSTLMAAHWQKDSGGQPNVLWDDKKHEWAYVAPRNDGLGPNPLVLPDGCVLSISPMRLFNPRSGTITSLADPGIGPEFSNASSTVLTDGTVVATTALYDAPGGTGFFYRKASCAGFATTTDDVIFMPSMYQTANESAKGPAKTIQLAGSWLDRVLRLAKEYRWVILAVLGSIAAYLLIRYLISPLFRSLWRLVRGKRIENDPEIRWSRSFRWTIRIILYSVAAAIVLPIALRYFLLKKYEMVSACMEKPSACLNESTGILKGSDSLAKGESGSKGEPHIPCRYVGIWSSNQPGNVFRVTLNDDGTYAMAPAEQTLGASYTGYWAVQGNSMIWRHNQNNTGELDVNLINQINDTRFTLTEQNGSQTRYDLIESMQSSKCVP